ncbi:MAG: UDP-N-acetylmuramate--L-alanine ligase [candidate division Zixibacteria bacterium]|nr:UDP-N-acetylmuramate--L-alanine ligase [candidate division Zixibacteria bacterium]
MVKEKRSVLPVLRKIRSLHFVGIGGTGMCGMAEILFNLGYRVTGSDLAASEATDRLIKLGVPVQFGHKRENIFGANVVVISSAVKEENPEVAEARKEKIPVIRRAEMLGELMRMKFGIAVSGTHGKTTTTSMIGQILSSAGLDPTIVVGGRVVNLDTHAKLGQGEFMVCEADEYDRSFLSLSPHIAVATNLEADHLDYYKNLEEIKEAFVQFLNRVPFYGTIILCADEANLRSIEPALTRPVLRYGIVCPAKDCDFWGEDIRMEGLATYFVVKTRLKEKQEITLHVPGVHNVKNALASAVAGREIGLSWDKIAAGLAEFRGVRRRFEIKGKGRGVTVVDDYAHHPTEIETTIRAARAAFPKARLIAAFQPHLFSRTRDFSLEFAVALSAADRVVLTEIYPSREQPISGVSSALILEGFEKVGFKNFDFVARWEDVASVLLPRLSEGDLVITLGAGSIYRAGEKLVELLK